MRYKDFQKAEQMRAHIEACQSGGLTVEQYCREHCIKKSSYYYWHKRLAKPPGSEAFVPLNFSSVHGGDVVVITFPNGVSITFSSAINISVLKELACCI